MSALLSIYTKCTVEPDNARTLCSHQEPPHNLVKVAQWTTMLATTLIAGMCITKTELGMRRSKYYVKRFLYLIDRLMNVNRLGPEEEVIYVFWLQPSPTAAATIIQQWKIVEAEHTTAAAVIAPEMMEPRRHQCAVR